MNGFVAETLWEQFHVRNETLVVMGKGSSHELTLRGVLVVFLPIVGVTLLALRAR